MQLSLWPTNTGVSSFYEEKEFQTLFNKGKVVVTTNYLFVMNTFRRSSFVRITDSSKYFGALDTNSSRIPWI